MNYAIVDIETTGSHANSNGITEIAIYIFDGSKIVKEFSSLVNPGVPIPPFLESYTGITNQMVQNAPPFSNIASKVYDLLKDTIFIAHNVHFDYSFIHYQLLQNGFNLNIQKLCTVKLSRKVFPGYKSYSLGNICESIGIPISNRHRAAGDALATVQLFAKILANDIELTIVDSLKKSSKEYLLPPNLPKEQFEKLPSQAGVYYFHDRQGKIIYVGKGKNIKKQVGSHFSSNKINKQKLDFLPNIFSVSFTVCATELMSFMLEYLEIKNNNPLHNKSIKTLEYNFAIYDYVDRNNYVRLAIDRTSKSRLPLRTFKTQIDALEMIQHLVSNYNLCPKLCGATTSKEECFIVKRGKGCRGACQQKETSDNYNKGVTEAINWLNTIESYAIIDKGINSYEASCILVENGKFYGMGYLPIDQQKIDVDYIKSMISPYKNNFYMKEILHVEELSQSGKIIRF